MSTQPTATTNGHIGLAAGILRAPSKLIVSGRLVRAEGAR
jgi:hypothetical protein